MTIPSGMLAGALVGAMLTAAESVASLLVNAPVPFRMSCFLAAYHVPALAAAGLILGLLRRLRGDLGGTVVTLTWLTAFFYAAVLTHQDLVRPRGGTVPLRAWAIGVCIASALGGAVATQRLMTRAAAGASVLLASMRGLVLLPFVAALTVSAMIRYETTPLLAIALPPVLGVLAAAACARPLAWCGGRGGVALVVIVLAILTPLAASAALAGARWRSALVDEPQPARRPEAASGPAMPNVVLVVLDAVRASSMSAYGYARPTTPRLDAFAAGAVRFTRATTPSPWSVPSHASLFTGLLPDQHGAGRAMIDRGRPPRPAPLPDAGRTIAEALSERGYATAAVSANLLVAPAMGLAQGFRHFDARLSPKALPVGYVPLLIRLKRVLPAAVIEQPMMAVFPSTYRSAEEISDSAIGWLDTRDRAQPYFLFLNYMDAHTPFVPRAGFSDRFPGRSPRWPSFGLPTAVEIQSGSRPSRPEEREHLRALYDGSLAYLDHQVGRLLEHLLRQEDQERTWIIVTADHGEALGEHGRIGHDCILYEEVLAVPLIVRYPRVPGPWAADAEASVDSRPIQTVDVARQLFRLLDASQPGPAVPDDRPRLASVDCYCAAEHPLHHGSWAAALDSGSLKYIEEQGREPLLFDLQADPGETDDLAAREPERVASLRQDLVRLRESLRAGTAWPSERDERQREREEALRALGYVE